MEKRREKGLEEMVLESIMPTPSENNAIQAAISSVTDNVEKYVNKHYASIGSVDPVVVGSVAKGTYLHEPDVDIFMRFPVNITREQLEKIGIEIGKAVLQDPVLKYAEHPYVRGRSGSIAIDLVPCYRIEDSSKKMSAVDRTPFHTVYVNTHASAHQKDQIRILKRFFKGIGVYGADARIRGFSGYLCELLVISIGDFSEVMKKAAEWDIGTIITPPDASLGKKLKDAEACIIVPDPVDSERNVAAALDKNSFATAVVAAKYYLDKPAVNFFYPVKRQPASLAQLKSRADSTGHGLLMIILPRPAITDDNLYPQVVKARKSISALLEKYDFDVNRSIYLVDSDIRILFELKNSTHPSYWLREGPPGWSQASDNFITKHRRESGGIVIVDGILYSEEKKEFESPRKLIASKLKELSTGADLDRLRGEAVISVGSEVLAEENRLILAELLYPSFPWE
jgi:tRNA nucleotidyltransferase (CCA-adding enzyme)